jgi:hypothetical protein
MKIKEIKFLASKSSGEVSAILQIPDKSRCLLVLAHGAGANIRHHFMTKLAEELAEQRIATFRYNFPYMEQGKKAPGPQPILLKTVRSAVQEAKKMAGGLPLIAGGKSLGGRMTSTAQSLELLEHVNGIVFFGFPLLAPGRPSDARAEHLYYVTLPMLFLQGTRDKLADLQYLRPVCDKLGSVAKLAIFEEADHSFSVPRRTGKSGDDVLREMASTVAQWIDSIGVG